MIYNGTEIEQMTDPMLAEEGSKPYDIRHRAYFFSRDIIMFIARVDRDRVFDSLVEQLLRSATSIGANTVEGKSGSSQKDFVKYYRIALKSANETKYWLCLVRDTMQVDREAVTVLIREADELARIIAAIVLKNIGMNERK